MHISNHQLRRDVYMYMHVWLLAVATYLAVWQRCDQVLHKHPHTLDLDNPHHDDELGTALKKYIYI